jgi:hypothetical protein
VVLLYGNAPAWRTLSAGMTGADVRELNTALVRLGYATAAALGPRAGWDYFSSETACSLEQFQAHLGITNPTGALGLGQAVFLPSAVKITAWATAVTPGVTAAPGARHLSSAPVTVSITTGVVRNALVVPVTALLAQPVEGAGEVGGGYAVEVTGAGRHHLVRVRSG